MAVVAVIGANDGLPFQRASPEHAEQGTDP
jgi:hypothetical protein